MKKFSFPSRPSPRSLSPAPRIAAPAKTGDSAKGKVLTDAKGMTLYTFDKDAGGKSACNGPCAEQLAAAEGRRRATRPTATTP